MEFWAGRVVIPPVFVYVYFDMLASPNIVVEFPRHNMYDLKILYFIAVQVKILTILKFIISEKYKNGYFFEFLRNKNFSKFLLVYKFFNPLTNSIRIGPK